MISLFPLSAFTLHRNPFFLFVVRMLKLNNKYDWQLQFYSIQTMYALHSLGGKLCRIFSFEFMSVCYAMRVKIPIIRWRWKLHIYTFAIDNFNWANRSMRLNGIVFVCAEFQEPHKPSAPMYNFQSSLPVQFLYYLCENRWRPFIRRQ